MEHQKEKKFFKDPVKKALLLSHHPPCEIYKDHVIQIGKNKLCIGCFVGGFSAIIGFILGGLMVKQRLVDKEILLYLGIGFISTQLLSLTRITDQKTVKIIQKICIGLGFAFILIAFYNYLPFSTSINVLICIGGFMVVNSPLQLFHTRNNIKICNQCAMKWDQENCPRDYCYADFPQKKSN
jgi:hypothetical protein